MRTIIAAAGLIAVLATATACSATSGHVQTAPTTPASTSVVAAPSSSVAAPTTPSAAQTTVTQVVVPPSQPAARHTVTRVVTAQPPAAPRSGSDLTEMVRSAVPAPAGDYFQGTDTLFFDAPSQNIGCYIYLDGVSCAITSYDFPQPGPDCNRGIGADIDSSGYPTLTTCSGYFPVANQGLVLSYGQSLSNGSYGCSSDSSGITCVDFQSGTGYILSKQAFTPAY